MLKKLMLASLLMLTASLSFSAQNANCQEVLGDWNGRVGDLTQFELNIHPFDGIGNASMRFGYEGSETSFDLVIVDCTEKSDGSTNLHVHRDFYGVWLDAQMTLVNPNELRVDSFSYRDRFESHEGTGVLIR